MSNSYSTGTVTGDSSVGGLVGRNYGGTVSNSYSTGTVTGDSYVGGLVGKNDGYVSDSYSMGNVTGDSYVGGLVGFDQYGTVSNSYYSYDEVLINGENIITIGALSDEDFEEWLANDKFLDVDERLSQESGYHVINNVADFKQLLAFGQDGSLKFRLNNDLDLASEPNFYIPWLAGEFDGNGHTISNLSLNFDFASCIGLFGFLDYGGKVTHVGVKNVNVTGHSYVGGLAGFNAGNVSNSYSTGNVTGDEKVGGLVGKNEAVSWWFDDVNEGDVSDSYSTGNVTGSSDVGGLVGKNEGGTVIDSFWDTETSAQSTSAGGTGKNTTEMKDITTFTDTETVGLDEPWDMVAVANPSVRNPSYIWNIVDDVTYPFLSWQS